MSRLAAEKEWAFMKILYEHDFPVPKPIDHARHCLLMEAIDAYPLRQVSDIPSPGKLYSTLMDIIVRFARAGLIHGDYNEFNILIKRDSGDPVVIDFPQMVSTSHANAEWYFNRDVECIRTFFRKRFKYESSLYPRFRNVSSEDDGKNFQLDVVVAASGWSKKEQKVLEEYMDAVKEDEPQDDSDTDEEEEEEESEAEAEEEEEEAEDATDGDDEEQKVDSDDKAEAAHEETVHTEADVQEDADRSPVVSRPSSRLSRSPPKSRSPSPSSLAKMTASLSLGSVPTVHGKVKSDLAKKARQQKKYHSKRSVQRAGRPQGSKAKQDSRVKLDKSEIWG